MQRDNQPTLLKNLLDELCRCRNWQTQLHLNSLFAFWDEVTGAVIAAKAQPRYIRGTVLWLDVCDNVWMQQLQFQKITLLDKLNDRLGEGEKLTDIRFQLASVPFCKREDETEQAPAPEFKVDSAALKQFEAMTAGVGDEKMKEAMKSLWLAMEKAKMTRKIKAGE